MKFNGLRCTECSGELSLNVGYDGRHEDAERYNPDYSDDWGWMVSLHCEDCGRSYGIIRTTNFYSVSAIRDSQFGGEIIKK